MSAGAVAAAAMAGLAVLSWWWPPYVRWRLARIWPLGRDDGEDSPPGRTDPTRDHHASTPNRDEERAGRQEPRRPVRARHRHRVVGALSGFAAGVLVGGGAGFVVGLVTAVVVDQVLARLEPQAARIRRERLAADLPLAADLLAACLRAGRPPTQAVEAVSAALAGPLGGELATVVAALRLGSGPATAWQRFLDDAALAPFGRGMVRVWDSGAPLADTLDRLADDARRARRTLAEQRARAVGVKAAAPLGLCFLPAFVLVGIVPLVAGAVGNLVG